MFFFCVSHLYSGPLEFHVRIFYKYLLSNHNIFLAVNYPFVYKSTTCIVITRAVVKRSLEMVCKRIYSRVFRPDPISSLNHLDTWMDLLQGFQTRSHQFSQPSRYMNGFTPGFSDQIPSVLSTTWIHGWIYFRVFRPDPISSLNHLDTWMDLLQSFQTRSHQ